MSDRMFLQLVGHNRLGRGFNLDNPQTFNEKLNWLKINDRNPKYSIMADKYAVKQFVHDACGVNTAKCYGVYTSFNDIDFDSLPNSFVLKATHDSSGATICHDKGSFNKERAKNKFDHYLSHNNYWGLREWVYKDIPPRIIVEELLDDGSGKELQDYKFWCFNGEPRLMYVTNKGKDIYENFYDMNFCPVNVNHGFPRRIPEYEKPAEFERMKALATELSKGIPFVRVDFFDIQGNIYFGEFTFYDWAGLRPFSANWDKELGEWIILPTD